MDALYFKTYDKDLLLQELNLHTNPDLLDGRYFDGSIFEDPEYMLVWTGKKANQVDEQGQVITWQDGEFFNVWVTGQEQMDFFTTLRTAQLLTPETPDLKLF